MTTNLFVQVVHEDDNHGQLLQDLQTENGLGDEGVLLKAPWVGGGGVVGSTGSPNPTLLGPALVSTCHGDFSCGEGLTQLGFNVEVVQVFNLDRGLGLENLVQMVWQLPMQNRSEINGQETI